MRPLISIVVPVYNAGPYLEPCLQSLLAQTYRPLEILLVDDHSTDGSSELCRQWAENHSLVRRIPGTNRGANGGRWLGVQAAAGDFVLCSDADDLAHPQLVEMLYRAVCTTGLPCACCRYDTFSDTALPDPEYEGPAAEAWRDTRPRQALLHDKRVDWGLWNKLYLRDLLTRDAFETGVTYNEDLLTNWILLGRVSGMAFVDFAGYHYRQHSASISRRSLSQKQLEDQMQVACRIEQEAAGTPLEESASAFRYEKLLYLYSLILRQPDRQPFAELARAYRAQIRRDYCSMKPNPFLSRPMKAAALASGWLSGPYGFFCRHFLEKR